MSYRSRWDHPCIIKPKNAEQKLNMTNPLALTADEKNLLKSIEHFFREDLIAQNPKKSYLIWLYEMLYAPGTVLDKLVHLPNLRIPYSVDVKLQILLQHQFSKHFNSPYFTIHFDKLLEKVITEIQASIPHLLKSSQLKSFVRKQLQTPISYYHYEFINERTAQEKEKISQHLENFYNIIRKVYYLHTWEIAESYFQFDPLKCNVLPKAPAQELQLKFKFQPIANLLNYQYSLSFTGEQDILNEMDDILQPICFEQMIKAPTKVKKYHYQNIKAFATKLEALTMLSEPLKEILGNQFTEALTGLQSCSTNQIVDLPSQTEFYEY